MRRLVAFLGLLAFLWASPVHAAERLVDLTGMKPGEPPAGFRATLAGQGKPGDWRVVLDDIPSAFAPLTPNAPNFNKRPVIAQLSRDPTDERFPILLLADEDYGDFTLTLRFKTVGGALEQMAGVVFRYQDEKNFYVARASTIGSTFRFYKVIDGLRSKLIGPNDIEIPKDVWHELSVDCRGNQIRIELNGADIMPELTDNSFRAGAVGLWTKSDSVSYFTDLRVTYTPRETQAAKIVREVMRDYPRLLGFRIYAPSSKQPEVHVVASNDPAEFGTLAGPSEKKCLATGEYLAGKQSRKVFLVNAPLRDRNGDPIAVAQFELKSFAGETKRNAMARASVIMRKMPFIRSLENLSH